MKKIFVITLVLGLTSVACSKKENVNEESNVMLQEPEVTVVADTAKTAVSTPATTEATPAADSTATK
ncbi:hypothetical protein JSO62_00580 [Riemerella anatipestifer]|uniref:hypothetical protein n=1 Tax=Riemerella anatipestifer TaxID=34085 RepID=UPI0030C395C4